MADIITRLLLKTNDFDANLNKAKGSVNNFQGGISDMAKTAGAGIAKFAGAVGLAVGASEAMIKTINSTQTTGDAFAKMMDQSKASVDAFFTSIAMGDFSGFLSNLGNVINKAGDLSVILDELATKSLFSNAELNTLMTSKKIQENIARDKTKSDKERNTALNEARKIQLEINKLQSGLVNTNQQSAYATLDSAIAKQGLKGNVARSTWDYALKESNRPTLVNYSNLYREKYNKVENAKEINADTGRMMDTPESQRLKLQLDKWLNTSNGRFAEFSYYFTEMDDSLESDLGKAIEMNNKANSMKGAISDANLLLNNTDAKINGSYKKKNGGEGGNEDLPPALNSLSWFDAELAKKNKELITATGMQARAAVQATIDKLENQRIELLIKEKDGSLEAITLQLSELNKRYISATTDEARTEIYKLITELEAKKIHVNLTARYDEKKAPLKDAGLPVKGIDTKNMKLPKHETPIKKQDIKLNEEYGESLSAISDIMGNMSGLFDENTASVLQWGASFISTIGQAIPKIVEMMGVKATDTVVTQENTTATALNAGTKVIDAHAGIPFVGVALGLAGLAAIIGAMASMPKFAAGGIVGGVSFAGDKVPALVNSGEMILNSGQQGNLFKLLNSTLYSSANAQPQINSLGRLIAPDQSGRKIEVFGSFSVRGRDLKLALDNNEKKKR